MSRTRSAESDSRQSTPAEVLVVADAEIYPRKSLEVPHEILPTLLTARADQEPRLCLYEFPRRSSSPAAETPATAFGASRADTIAVHDVVQSERPWPTKSLL